MRRMAVTAVMALGLMLASDGAPAAAPASIHGKVLAAGKPAKGARVWLRGPVKRDTTTDAEGAFAFVELPAGRYRLVAKKPGFQRAKKNVSLAAGKKLRLVLKLKPQPAPEEQKPQAEPSAAAGTAAVDKLAEAEAPAAAPPPRTRHRRARKMGKARPRGPRPTGGLVGSRAQPRRQPAPLVRADDRVSNSEQYVDHGVRQWEDPDEDHLSTFSIDVDTASYTIARRKLKQGRLPPPASVRTEEFINYFEYDYAPPTGPQPFAVHMEAAPSPFEPKLHLLRIGIKGEEAKGEKRKPVHLTFLVDTSGSMRSRDKIGLLKRSLRFLVDQLQEGDTVALCTYAGSVRKVLDPTGMQRRDEIHAAIAGLDAGGSTAMASGLELAYQLAYANIEGEAVNRVIVCSDGDANVGRTEHGPMLKSIRHYAEEGVTLSTIGFGMGNYKDHRMEQLADKGNGNYYYIDTFSEAKKVFGKQLMGTLQVIAKDVKIQVDFDSGLVEKYRLVGYENRDIADRDFRDDRVDAGEIGAGHTVTALYELELAEPRSRFCTVRIRWKKPKGVKADEKAYPFAPGAMKAKFARTSRDFRRAVAAAALAENLRDSPFKESWTIDKAQQLAREALSRESKVELGLIELIDTSARLLSR